MEERLLTVREVAELTQLHEITIRRYIAAGKLDAVRIGRRIRVPLDAVARLIKPVYPSRTAPAGPSVEETAIAYRTDPASDDDTAESGGASPKLAGSVDPLWSIVGLFDSGQGSLAEDHDDWLAGPLERENSS